jgi:uncharacterized protein (TIGR03000 family)
MMRNTLLILSLAGLTVLASASDAFAQRRIYGGGWGYSPGISIGVGRGGYYAPYSYYGGLGYSPYYLGSGYGYSPSYYYTTPSYGVIPMTYAQPAPMQIRQSYYPVPTTVLQSVSVTVLVPAADAQVWFENRATSQQGTERLFESPLLEPNHNFTYTIKARWLENGKAVDGERRVSVQAGQSVTVNFRESSGESVPPPLPSLPNPLPRE